MKRILVKVLSMLLVFASFATLCVTVASADSPLSKNDLSTRYYYDKDRYYLSTNYSVNGVLYGYGDREVVGGTVIGPYYGGNTYDDVVSAQASLKKIAVFSNISCDPGSIDGSFGNGTATAVSNFQSAVGITSDGWVGNQTWYYLEQRTNDRNA